MSFKKLPVVTRTVADRYCEIAESTMSYYYLDGGFYGKQSLKSIRQVLDEHLNDKKLYTRDWILREYHEAGAIGCSGSVCAIIFSNQTMLQGECEKE